MILAVEKVKKAIVVLDEICTSLCEHLDEDIKEYDHMIEPNYFDSDLAKDIQDCKRILNVRFIGMEYYDEFRYSVPTYEVEYLS